MSARKAVILAILAVVSAATFAQSVKGAAAGLGKALGELADKQIDANLEIEIARKKAEIEVETQRQLLNLRQAQAQPKQPNGDAEVAKLQTKHPQWAYIVVSPAFKSWIAARPVRQECMRTQLASVMAACIEHFFQTAVFQAE